MYYLKTLIKIALGNSIFKLYNRSETSDFLNTHCANVD